MLSARAAKLGRVGRGSVGASGLELLARAEGRGQRVGGKAVGGGQGEYAGDQDPTRPALTTPRGLSAYQDP
jgi:hypothetical protein